VARQKPLLSKRHMTAHPVWRKPGTILMVNHGGGSIMLWQCFSATGTGRRVGIEGKMNGQSTERSLMKTCSRAHRTSDWVEGLPSNRTMTLSTRPRQRRNDFWTSLNVLVAQPEPGYNPIQVRAQYGTVEEAKLLAAHWPLLYRHTVLVKSIKYLRSIFCKLISLETWK
jgi:hypothetical protein